MPKHRTIIGLAGHTLDRGTGADRWNHWRPTVALCQHEDLLIDRYLLIHQANSAALAEVLREDIRSVSPETTVELRQVDFRDPWDFRDVYDQFYALARTLPRQAGEEYLVNVTTGTHVAQICLFLLTEARQIPGQLIQAIPPRRAGDPRPGRYAIIDLDLSRYDHIAERFAREQQDDISFLKGGIETRNAAFNELIERIERVALRSTDPLLLMGPTGAGKSQLARRIYDLAAQKRSLAGAFVEANCATLRGDAAMSTLFGHKKGAYTGAAADRPGLLRAAHQGMLFLDEIGELGLDEQGMLLRAVEEKIFFPLGSDAPVKSSFQLVCGTNRDLRQDVREGRFRGDLLARIDLWAFTLPGLAERREDIEPNLAYELERFSQRTGRRVTFNKEALARFLTFARDPATPWTANFRDLTAAVTRMATLANAGRINVANVDDEIARLQAGWRTAGPAAGEGLVEAALGPARARALDLFDRVQLEGVLRVCRESPTMAAAGRQLFAASRAARSVVNDSDRLRKYLLRFGLDWAAARGGG